MNSTKLQPRPFALALKEARSRSGFSLRQLGELVNFSSSYLWELEKGKKDPHPATVVRLEQVLSCPGVLVAAAESNAEAARPPVDSLGYPRDWETGVETAVALWRSDVTRNAETGMAAIEQASALKSVRAIDYLRRIAANLAPYAGVSAVDELPSGPYR